MNPAHTNTTLATYVPRYNSTPSFTKPQMPTVQNILQNNLNGVRVLITDDSSTLRAALRRVLERSGAVVTEARDGPEALELTLQHPIDIILLDVEMPGMTGFEVCQALRKDPRTARLPIAMITGMSDEIYHTRALQDGADDFVPKPFHSEVLVARVRNLVSRYRAERENKRLVHELERYVSSAVHDQIRQHHSVESIEATILFTDVRGFTEATERIEPSRMFAAMDQVLGVQAQVVTEHAGYVDKFVGDGMLAVFCEADHTQNAIRAALQIAKWARTCHLFSFWDPVPIGLGIDVGQILRGDLGSTERREYTVLGRTVNLASRLCAQADTQEVLVSTQVHDALSREYQEAQPRELTLKGFAGTTRAWSIRDGANASS